MIVTTGVSYRQLEVPGATELAGAGVYYGAATTEAHAVSRRRGRRHRRAATRPGQAAVHLVAIRAGAVHLVVRGDDVSSAA